MGKLTASCASICDIGSGDVTVTVGAFLRDAKLLAWARMPWNMAAR